jgi:hypothetical protein
MIYMNPSVRYETLNMNKTMDLPGSSIGVEVKEFCHRKLFFNIPKVFIAKEDM